MITYCEEWSDELRSPTNPMSEDEARELDARGEQYRVVLGDPAKPDVVIEVVPENNYHGVNFLDDRGWTVLNYTFRPESDRLFLKEVVTWEYDENAQFEFDAFRTRTIEFRPHSWARETVEEDGKDAEVAIYTDFDVSLNWEPKPDWNAPGEIRWASIARRDRDKQPA